MMRRLARRLRAFWHRRELRWAMAELGVADLDELDALFARPFSAAEERFCATREEILARRNPALLVEERLWAERIERAVWPMIGAGR